MPGVQGRWSVVARSLSVGQTALGSVAVRCVSSTCVSVSAGMSVCAGVSSATCTFVSLVYPNAGSAPTSSVITSICCVLRA